MLMAADQPLPVTGMEPLSIADFPPLPNKNTQNLQKLGDEVNSPKKNYANSLKGSISHEKIIDVDPIPILEEEHSKEHHSTNQGITCTDGTRESVKNTFHSNAAVVHSEEQYVKTRSNTIDQ
ncbi:hypothetical protein FXO37_32074 [Capsicum annuum]|nr:hypothetical protein FXO37_32074 [Capsicum annuum]